jgi:GNAT superfamily N-acetyltransferase
MISQLQISAGRPSDVPTILAMIRELAAEEPSIVTATEHDLLRDGFGRHPRFQVLLARMNGHAIGFALYGFTYSTYRGASVLFLDELYVRPDHRGRGTGLALMQALAREAVRQGCARLAWEVLEGNNNGIAFYASLGAELQPERLMTWLAGSPLRKLAGE